MTSQDIVRLRLHNQHLTGKPFTSAASAVQWLGAVQAQDYGGAKWALSQRTGGLASAELDDALAKGHILRTHVMRPTWHFVVAADIRWMLALTAPRVKKTLVSYTRKLDMDEAFFVRCNHAIAQALKGGLQLTRAELAHALRQAGIPIGDGVAMGFITAHAELDAIMCSGALRGKQHTYALLQERAPHAQELPLDKALAELTLRYFTSHGPATAKDFAWWSGLSMAQVKAGLDMMQSQLTTEEVNGHTYWLAKAHTIVPGASSAVYLLPNYDEYTIAYTHRDDYIDPRHVTGLDARNNVIFNNAVIVDGRLVGMWRRTLKNKEVIIDTQLFVSFTATQKQALQAAVKQYGTFVGLPARFN